MKRRKTVLHICKIFDLEKGGGGVTRHIAGLIHAMQKSEFEFRILSPVIGAGITSDAYTICQFSFRELYKHVAWADVVHIHGARTPFSAALAIVGLIMCKRVVYTPHCYYDDAGFKGLAKQLWDQTVERLLLGSSSSVILLSEYWQSYIEKRKLPVKKVQIIPNCVLDAWISPPSTKYKKLAGSPAILSIGRLDPVKKIDTVIRALLSPELATACLHIVGAGDDRQRLTALAEELNVVDRIIFHGFVSDSEVPILVAGADVFVLSSAQEGMPTTLIEMILMRLPIVASDIPGNRSILEKIGYDVMHTLGDHEDLARKIATSHPVPQSVIEEAKRLFTWEQQWPLIRATYETGDKSSSDNQRTEPFSPRTRI